MVKLVELYIADNYTGIHTLETAKQYMWNSRGFCHLRHDITEEQFMREDNLNTINSWMTTGGIKLIGEINGPMAP